VRISGINGDPDSGDESGSGCIEYFGSFTGVNIYPVIIASGGVVTGYLDKPCVAYLGDTGRIQVETDFIFWNTTPLTD
jgi:hypothetical protein